MDSPKYQLGGLDFGNQKARNLLNDDTLNNKKVLTREHPPNVTYICIFTVCTMLSVRKLSSNLLDHYSFITLYVVGITKMGTKQFDYSVLVRINEGLE